MSQSQELRELIGILENLNDRTLTGACLAMARTFFNQKRKVRVEKNVTYGVFGAKGN